jgi:Fic family protein
VRRFERSITDPLRPFKAALVQRQVSEWSSAQCGRSGAAGRPKLSVMTLTNCISFAPITCQTAKKLRHAHFLDCRVEMGANGCNIGVMIVTNSVQITPEILSLIAGVDEFKGAWRALGTLAPDRLSALRRVATIESIGSSTRIEGSRLSDREVERLLSNLQIKSFTTRDEQEVAGYAEIMELVFSSWQDIALTENHIKRLHRDLLTYSDKDAWHRGNYKTSTNSVVAFDEDGKQLGVVFATATPFDTPLLMTELVEWFNAERQAARLHPLMLIGIWVVVFLEIHPFQDGNGRLSRVLTTLLLLQAGYAYVPYSSLESVIEQSKEAYYLALRQTQGTIRTTAPNWQPWLTFFLRALAEQVRRLNRKVEREKLVLASLPELSLQIVEFAREHGRITMGDAIRLTNGNRNTLKQHFRGLVEQGHLSQHGAGRGVWYELR